MPQYQIQIRYNARSTQGLVGNPQDRRPQAAAIMEKLGGRLRDFWFTFGEWDALLLVELPDDTHALAVAMADVAGEVGETRLTRLYDMDDARAAMRIARDIDYRAPE